MFASRVSRVNIPSQHCDYAFWHQTGPCQMDFNPSFVNYSAALADTYLQSNGFSVRSGEELVAMLRDSWRGPAFDLFITNISKETTEFKKVNHRKALDSTIRLINTKVQQIFQTLPKRQKRALCKDKKLEYPGLSRYISFYSPQGSPTLAPVVIPAQSFMLSVLVPHFPYLLKQKCFIQTV